MQRKCMRHSAQRREIELGCDGISSGGSMTRGGVRSEGLGKELELNGCADERASAIPQK